MLRVSVIVTTALAGIVLAGMGAVSLARAQNGETPAGLEKPAPAKSPAKKKPATPEAVKPVQPAQPSPDAAPAQPAASGKVWDGTWKLSVGGKAYPFVLTDASVGTIGGVFNGSLMIENSTCVVSGTWFAVLAGLYPDGNHIAATNLNRLVNWTAACPDGRKASSDMFFVPSEAAIIGASGRIQWTDAAGKPVSMDMATLERRN